MQKGLTNILVVFVTVTSLAAAPRSSNSSSAVLRDSDPAAHQSKRSKPYQIGRASWYGKPFHGKMTASGEPYDMFLFTAAHRRLPLGTLVRVTNLSNGLSVVVRVNDRGPVPRSRIIDLSYGAAEMLQLRQEGVDKVRLDLLTASEAAAVEDAKLQVP